MRKEYDFSKSRKNPYAKQLKRQVTIRLDTSAVEYFKKLAAELGMPYQNLINLFLRDCATQQRRPTIQWPPAPEQHSNDTPVLNSIRGILKKARSRRR
jgi:antitoxin component of RelBE/YafQ-DinJ toxin-antitoxin module